MSDGTSITIKDLKVFLDRLGKAYPDLDNGYVDGMSFTSFKEVGLNDDRPVMDRIEMYCKTRINNNWVDYKVAYYADGSIVIEKTTTEMIKTTAKNDQFLQDSF